MNATLIAVIAIDLLLVFVMAFALFGNFSNLKNAIHFLLMPYTYARNTNRPGKDLGYVYKFILLLVLITAVIAVEVNYL